MINELKVELAQLCNEIIEILERLKALEIITEEEFKKHVKVKRSFLEGF